MLLQAHLIGTKRQHQKGICVCIFQEEGGFEADCSTGFCRAAHSEAGNVSEHSSCLLWSIINDCANNQNLLCPSDPVQLLINGSGGGCSFSCPLDMSWYGDVYTIFFIYFYFRFNSI